MQTNNSKPHFLHGKPWDHNIRLTALALNTCMNLLNTVIAAEGNATPRDVVCAKVAEEVSSEALSAMLAIAEKKNSKNKLYASCNAIYQYELKGEHKTEFLKEFPESDDFFKHNLNLYKQHGLQPLS